MLLLVPAERGFLLVLIWKRVLSVFAKLRAEVLLVGGGGRLERVSAAPADWSLRSLHLLPLPIHPEACVCAPAESVLLRLATSRVSAGGEPPTVVCVVFS